MTKFTLTHQGADKNEATDLPFDTDLVNASMLVRFRQELGVTWVGVQAVLDAVIDGEEGVRVDLPEAVAMIALADQQRGVPVDLGWIADRITLADAISLRVDG